MNELDLVIMGSGPAGLSTALHLLQSDPSWAGRMVLLEKARHPRPKLCGGGMTRLGVETLKGLGLAFERALPQVWVEDVRLVYRGRAIHVRGRPQLIIFHRAELDAWMARQARGRGAVICQEEPVLDLTIDAHGATVRTNRRAYRTQAVVGGDGAKGIARRFLLEQGEKSRAARLLEVIAPATANGPGSAARRFAERQAVFDFTPVDCDLQGYFWDFPALVDGLPHHNRGVYDARLVSERRRARLPQLLQENLVALGGAGHNSPVQGHPIHRFSPRSRLALPRLLLVGDAAGIDPLFGEGIAPALAYGKVAAEALADAFARKDFSFGHYRRRVLRSKLGQYLLVRWAVAWGSYHLSGSAWFMHALWTLGELASLAFAPPTPLPYPAPGLDQKG